MALNYTRHEVGRSDSDGFQTVPRMLLNGAIGAGQRLALNTNSAAIVGPCELRLQPDEDVTVDVRADTGTLNPAASTLVLRSKVTDWFSLPPGTWYIKAVAA